MPLSRRRFVAAAGSTGLALAAGAAGWRVMRTPTTALAPWTLGPPPADARLDAFRHAILAPNPHNRQPWVIRLVGADQAVLTCDLDRRLPQTDPFDRQIVIGFGCFIEQAAIAAASRGYRLDVTPFPDGEPAPRLDARPIAHLRFVPVAGLRPDPLAAHMLARRSVKEPYDTTRPVPAQALAQLTAAGSPDAVVATTGAPERVAALRALTWTAWDIERVTPRAFMESVDLMRIGAAEVNAQPDGISLRGPLIEALLLTGQISRAQMARLDTSAHQAGIDKYRAMLSSSMAFAWIVTAAGTRAAELAAGRAHQRLHLTATALGLALQPVSQALQEFPEMAGPLRDLNAELGVGAGRRVQMLNRLGYGPAVAASPRWPLETRLARA